MGCEKLVILVMDRRLFIGGGGKKKKRVLFFEYSSYCNTHSFNSVFPGIVAVIFYEIGFTFSNCREKGHIQLEK